MLGNRWLWLAIVFFVAAHADESAEVDEDEKEVFVPIKYQSPKLTTKPHFFDDFANKNGIGKTWFKSTAKKDGVESEIAKYNGEWAIDTPSETSIEGDYGLVLKTKARHHAIAAKLNKPFVFEESPLVVQYQVQYEEGQECGGGYLKLLSSGAETDLDTFQDKTPYTIMFGPDKCGSTGKVHLIFRYKNPKNGSIDEYHAKQPSNVGSTYWDDHNTHVYKLVLQPEGTFTVYVDDKSLFYGNMLNDLVPSLTPPSIIDDPTDNKPEDWDERAEIEDETAERPEDWDENQPKEIIDESATKPSDWLEEEPELIPDPEAKKPEDWDVDIDGEWEPPSIDNPVCSGKSGCGPWKQPTIPNPLYKGRWVRPHIPNPAYKGVWKPRTIDNPHFFEPTAYGGLSPIAAIGIELWTMSENIIFDNILVTDSVEQAAEIAEKTYYVRKSEDARLAASKGQGNGILQVIIDAANERPWLWAVYVLCVLIPVILLGICCFGRKSSADTVGQRKKVDAFEEDDKIPNLIDDAEEAEEQAEEPKQKPPTPKASPKQVPKAQADIEDDDSQSSQGSASGDDEEDEEDEEKEPEPVPQPSPKKDTGATKRRARRQD